jgi:aspartate racemase
MTQEAAAGGPSPIGAGLIGIVSGLGPLAGNDVLDKALAYAATDYGAVEDVDYPDIVLFSHGIESFDSTGSIEDRFVRELVTVVHEIDLHHPTVLGVACDSAHLHLAELRKHTRAYVVNLIEEVAEEASTHPHNYLLLSSSTTRRTGLHRDALERRGVRFFDVSAIDQLEIDDVVHAVMAHDLEAAGAQLDELVLRIEAEPFNGIIAGCTELALAFDHTDVAQEIPVVDSNRVLARALVDTYFCIRGAHPTFSSVLGN